MIPEMGRPLISSSMSPPGAVFRFRSRGRRCGERAMRTICAPRA